MRKLCRISRVSNVRILGIDNHPGGVKHVAPLDLGGVYAIRHVDLSSQGLKTTSDIDAFPTLVRGIHGGEVGVSLFSATRTYSLDEAPNRKTSFSRSSINRESSTSTPFSRVLFAEARSNR
jgi:hypothetical protein